MLTSALKLKIMFPNVYLSQKWLCGIDPGVWHKLIQRLHVSCWQIARNRLHKRKHNMAFMYWHRKTHPPHQIPNIGLHVAYMLIPEYDKEFHNVTASTSEISRLVPGFRCTPLIIVPPRVDCPPAHSFEYPGHPEGQEVINIIDVNAWAKCWFLPIA